MIDVKTIRNDFPQLADPHQHFLDSAASSLTPQAVLDAMSEYYIKDKANVHRGLYPQAVRASARYEAVRSDVAEFINAFADEIIFTSGATEASNMLVRSLEETLNLKEGDEIVTTVMEHHSALVPLQQLAKRKKLVLKHIPLSDTEGLDYGVVEKFITSKTKVVSAMLVSNVTGMINDVARIADIAHKHGAVMLCDATAALGHIPVDVHTLHVDALYFSGHKMLGPTGIGVLWIKRDLINKLKPSIFGGDMVDHVGESESTWALAPTKFEAGTKNIGGVYGLGAAVKYLQEIGIANIHEHCASLACMAIRKLEEIPGVKVYSPRDPTKNAGIVSFGCDFAHPHDIAEVLAREGVAVRPGHHCAMPAHKAMNVKATTRVSFHVYNIKEDVDALVAGVFKAKEIFTN